MTDQKENVEDQNTPQDSTQEFIKEFESLMEKYNINEYISILKMNDLDFALYRPDDLMTITKKLKITHQNYYRQVMKHIGEIN